MMLHEAGHILGLNHPDKIVPVTKVPATATSDAVMYPRGSNHHLSAPCGPNPWALMVPGVPDGAELDPRTGVRPAAMATMERGDGNRYRCLQPDDLEGLAALYPPNCVGAHAPGITPTIVCPTFEHEAEFVTGGGGDEMIVLTLTASGSVSDYSDTSSLQQKFATVAGVDKSFVTISVAAASVIITATITVPASMTAAAVQTSLSSTLGTADKASAALGITVESDSTIKTVTIEPEAEVHVLPEGDSDSSSMGAIIGGAVGGLLALCCCIGIGGGVFFYMKQKKPPASASTYAATELATAPQQIEVIVSQPGAPAKQAAAPQSLAALLAACGLEHRAKAFEDEGYTLENLISSLKQGEQVAKGDLRELKLTLGECRQLITKVQGSM